MTSSNNILKLLLIGFVVTRYSLWIHSLNTSLDPIKLRWFLMAVHTPTKLMYDVMMTSYNCYITVIFQSFQNTFIKMHQNLNINTFI